MKIIIEALKIPMYLGVYEKEKQNLIYPELNISIFFTGRKVLRTNKLQHTINYDNIIRRLEKELAGKSFDLIEELVKKIYFLLKEEKYYIKLEISVRKAGTHAIVNNITVCKTFYKNFICFLYCFICKI